jgi:hypothetical protein
MTSKTSWINSTKSVSKTAPFNKHSSLIPDTLKINMETTTLSAISMFASSAARTSPKTPLGCVTFSYYAKTKLKGCRNVNDRSELFKKTFVAKSVEHAMNEFNKWHESAKTELKTWNLIM